MHLLPPHPPSVPTVSFSVFHLAIHIVAWALAVGLN